MLISVCMMCFVHLSSPVCRGMTLLKPGARSLLLLARLFRGLSVGGEYGTSATYMSEIQHLKVGRFFTPLSSMSRSSAVNCWPFWLS